MSGWMDYFSRRRSRYTALPTNEAPAPDSLAALASQTPDDRPQVDLGGQYERTRRALRATAVGLMLLTVGALAVAYV
jgi:hypothetical protein